MGDASHLTWQQYNVLRDLQCRITRLLIEQDTGDCCVFHNQERMAVIEPDGTIIEGYTFSDGSTVHPSVVSMLNWQQAPIPADEQPLAYKPWVVSHGGAA